MKLLFEKNNSDIKKMMVVIKESAVTSITEVKILKKVKEDQLKSFSSEILELYKEAQKIKGVDFAGYKKMKNRADILYKRLHTWVRMLKLYKKVSEKEEDTMFL
jgi:hydroxyethylthiazole kinase-like sugar kinase family protein